MKELIEIDENGDYKLNVDLKISTSKTKVSKEAAKKLIAYRLVDIALKLYPTMFIDRD